ncbi:MAG: WecB/TagA/CpsF family glycosyltransferase [Clostridium perfringens]|nr:WecB/TagA/CpsF family glycosyltransferase [Clostridium perfringens]
MYRKLLDYNVFSGDKAELMDEILKKPKVNIISGNPEVLYNGLNNSILRKSYSSKDSIIIPDGVGTIIASKIYGEKIEKRIPGIEVMDMLIDYCEKNKKSIYLLGAKNYVVDKCTDNIKKLHPKINILGHSHGFFDMESCEDILKDINDLKPYALFVAMGTPRQELFIEKYKDILPCSIFMGVGGSFDILARVSKRAPKWIIDIGMEWFYRVYKDPKRIKRLKSISKFIFLSWQGKKTL